MADRSDSEAFAPKRLNHPWHGIRPIVADGRLLAFVENTRHDQMKLEVDLLSGYLKVDHPLQASSLPPYAYGFIPRTLCGRRLASLSGQSHGDQAPLDVFVVSEHSIPLPGVLAEIRLIGGVPVHDASLVDDKLIGVLHRDPAFADVRDVSELPNDVVERIIRFVEQNSTDDSTTIGDVYALDQARKVLEAAMNDYEVRFRT